MRKGFSEMKFYGKDSGYWINVSIAELMSPFIDVIIKLTKRVQNNYRTDGLNSVSTLFSKGIHMISICKDLLNTMEGKLALHTKAYTHWKYRKILLKSLVKAMAECTLQKEQQVKTSDNICTLYDLKSLLCHA